MLNPNEMLCSINVTVCISCAAMTQRTDMQNSYINSYTFISIKVWICGKFILTLHAKVSLLQDSNKFIRFSHGVIYTNLVPVKNIGLLLDVLFVLKQYCK